MEAYGPPYGTDAERITLRPTESQLYLVNQRSRRANHP